MEVLTSASLITKQRKFAGLTRLASRYDNVSASSLGDYYSLSSFVTAPESNSFSNLLDDDVMSSSIMTTASEGEDGPRYFSSTHAIR